MFIKTQSRRAPEDQKPPAGSQGEGRAGRNQSEGTSLHQQTQTGLQGEVTCNTAPRLATKSS